VSRLDADSAVTPLGDGRYRAVCTDAWSAAPGPNGGYVAAIVLRAMQAEAGPDRPVRSLTLHYLRPPRPGPLEVEVAVERTGRSLTTLTARLHQDGLLVIGVGAFAVDFAEHVAYSDPPPVAPPPPALQPVPAEVDVPEIARRIKIAPVLGSPLFSEADEAVTGGWIAFADGPQTLDAPALALLADAWMPAPFVRMSAFRRAPTIDLTIHFRAPELLAAEPVLGLWRSRASHGGFFEEDGELWSADGVLLAQSRQLALLL
jgi:acyl-CoA thioesterase